MTVATRWFLSTHALERMREMELERDEVCATLDDPQVTYPDPKYPHRTRYVAGRLVVVADEDAVVTVLWRTDDVYVRRRDHIPNLRKDA